MLSNIDLTQGFALVFLSGTVLPFIINPIVGKIEGDNEKKRAVYIISCVVAILLMATKGIYAPVFAVFTDGVTVSDLWTALAQGVGLTVASWGVITVLAKNIYDGVIHAEKKLGEQKTLNRIAAEFPGVPIAGVAAATAPLASLDIEELLEQHLEARLNEELAKRLPTAPIGYEEPTQRVLDDDGLGDAEAAAYAAQIIAEQEERSANTAINTAIPSVQTQEVR